MTTFKEEGSRSTDRRIRFNGLTVRRDGTVITSDELETAAISTAEVLWAVRPSRLALLAQCADQILVTLAAAEITQSQVLLCRTPALGENLIDQWEVTALLDSSMCLRKLRTVSVDSLGFSVLIMSSGTTGVPKLAQHSIESLLGRIRPASPDRERQRWLLTYHPSTYGGLQVLLSALIAGAELITTTNPTIARLCETALTYQPSHISGTPTFWRSFLVGLGSQASTLQLRQITLGGEIADKHILEALSGIYPAASISHIYASTEGGALFSVRDGLPGFPARWLETGIDGIELRIREGVLQVKSARGMQRYVTQESARVMTEDGWLITGDLAERTGDRVYFCGRKDMMLNVGGAKVRPEEVEEVLFSFSEISDARVYGIRNAITGFVLAADIVVKPGRDVNGLRAVLPGNLRSRLEAYKVPRIYNFVSSIATSEAGKKQKKD